MKRRWRKRQTDGSALVFGICRCGGDGLGDEWRREEKKRMRYETASRVVQKLHLDWSIAIDSDKPVVAAVLFDGAILRPRF